jgi:hypothetical protein
VDYFLDRFQGQEIWGSSRLDEVVEDTSYGQKCYQFFSLGAKLEILLRFRLS